MTSFFVIFTFIRTFLALFLCLVGGHVGGHVSVDDIDDVVNTKLDYIYI